MMDLTHCLYSAAAAVRNKYGDTAAPAVISAPAALSACFYAADRTGPAAALSFDSLLRGRGASGTWRQTTDGH
jgi:hypothetical protein